MEPNVPAPPFVVRRPQHIEATGTAGNRLRFGTLNAWTTRAIGKHCIRSPAKPRTDSSLQHGRTAMRRRAWRHATPEPASIRQQTLHKSTRCFTPDNYRNRLVSRPTNRRPSGFRQTQTFVHHPGLIRFFIRLASRAVPAGRVPRLRVPPPVGSPVRAESTHRVIPLV
jgi:hypothetical protein